MTTATMDMAVRPRRSLEELVDRLMAALFAVNTVNEVTEEPSAARSIHEARRLRQAGDMDGALAVLGGVDMAKMETREARWAFSEWKGLVKRRFGDSGALVYSQGHRQGRRAGSHRGRRDARSGGGAGDALEAGQDGLAAQPAGSEAAEKGLP